MTHNAENDRTPHTHGGTDAPECTPYGIKCPPAEKDVPPHECDTGHFDRTICPEPCGYMHSYCATCGTRQEPCAHDASPIPPGAHHPRCTGQHETVMGESACVLSPEGSDEADYTTLDDNYYDPPGGIPDNPWEQ